MSLQNVTCSDDIRGFEAPDALTHVLPEHVASKHALPESTGSGAGGLPPSAALNNIDELALWGGTDILRTLEAVTLTPAKRL